VSCSVETPIEQFIGSQVFEQGGFRFVEGPLIQAAREGCIFLADEFNLLSANVMVSLIPFLEARPGDSFLHSDVKDRIQITPGFLFVATGNENTERGRVRLPPFVLSQFFRLEVANPNAEHMEKLIQQIIDADYPNIETLRVLPVNIRLFVEHLKTILNVTWSLRSVRRFLRRVNDFAGFRPGDRSLPACVDVISVTDVALSFILCLPPFNEDRRDQMVAQAVQYFGGTNERAMAFANGHTKYVPVVGNHYLVRGHVALPVDKPANFPQPMLDTLFMARWCGTSTNQRLRESLLLVGPTSYKGIVLDFLLPSYANVYDMTHETQVSELIGSTILSTQARILEDTQHIVTAVSDALKQQTHFDVNQPNRGRWATELESEYRALSKIQNDDSRHQITVGVLRGAWFVHLSLDRMISANDGGRPAPKAIGSPGGIPILMCFVPSVVAKSAVLGIPLILRSIHLPPTFVLERLNSLLEDPRSLVLGEDTQRVFSNADIILQVTGVSSRSIPVCPGFSIAATASEAGYIGLSGPLQSRFTYIFAGPYRMAIPGCMEDREHSDLFRITSHIVEGRRELIKKIEEIYQSLQDVGRVKVTITEYVRWCTTTFKLVASGRISPELGPGVAALRTIADSLQDADRRRVTKEVLNTHLPVKLSYNVVTDGQEDPVMDCPIEVNSGTDDSSTTVASRISEIVIPSAGKPSLEPLGHVLWTRSSVDMADAVMTAVAARAITIFEGSPGRGKTAVAYAVLQSLGMICTRINLSPTTSAEDLFGRDIPQSAPEGGFTTRFVDGPLTMAMKESAKDAASDRPSQAILLDEINLASPQLLERLEGFILRMLEPGRYLLPNGKDICHGPIVIVATMNSAALSNARSALSTKLQGASHFLRLIPFNQYELKVLADAVLAEPGSQHTDPAKLQNVMLAHSNAALLLEQKSGTTSERDAVTLREFLRLRQFHMACPGFGHEMLIELVYATQFGSKLAKELLSRLGFTSKFITTRPLIRNGNLLFTDAVSLPLVTRAKDGPAELPVTTEQCRAACLIGAAIMAHRPVAIFGDSGSGKTHLVHSLAQVIGTPLGVVQFHSDTDSSSIIGALEIDGIAEEAEAMKKEVRILTRALISSEHPVALELANVAFADSPDLSLIAGLLTRIVAEGGKPAGGGAQEQISCDNLAEAKKLETRVKEFIARSVQNFVFKEGPLLKMMRQGGWVLLDAVDSAPHEVERLMSLLEEDPTLAVYEGVWPLRFYSRGSAPKALLDYPAGLQEEFVEISPNFQIFITCRDPQKLSPALRSRCFCVHIETAMEEDSLYELAESVLSRSVTSSLYAKPLSLALATVFKRTNPSGTDQRLLFSKDMFSPHRIVNCARGFGNDTITSDSLAEGFRMSFVSSFGNLANCHHVASRIRAALSEIASVKISDSQSGWEDLCLQAGRFEFTLVYNLFARDEWPSKANSRLDDVFQIVYPNSIRVRKLPEIGRPLAMDSVLTQLEDTLLGWISRMTVGDIRKTILLLDELRLVVTSLQELSDPALGRFFRALLFLEVLRPAEGLCGLPVRQGEILYQKRIDLEGFQGLETQERSLEQCAMYVAAIQHLVLKVRDLPVAFPLGQIFGGILSMVLSRFYADPVYAAAAPQGSALPLVCIPGLHWTLQNVEIAKAKDKSAALIRLLASGKRLIRLLLDTDPPPPSEDSESLYLVLCDGRGPVIRRGSDECLAQLDAIGTILPETQLDLKPWVRATISKPRDSEIDGLSESGLNHEIRIWILLQWFREVPAELLTQNLYFAHLINALGHYPAAAIRHKKSPCGASLTVLGPTLAAGAYRIVEYLGNLGETNPSDVVKRLLVGGSANDVARELSELKRDATEIVSILASVGLTVWDDMMSRLEAIRRRIDEIDNERKLEKAKKELRRRLQDSLDKLQSLVPQGSLLAREVELGKTFFELRTDMSSPAGIDPTVVGETITFISVYRQAILQKRDIGGPLAALPEIAKVTGYGGAPAWIAEAIAGLIQFTRAEVAIDCAASNSSFANIVSMIAAIDFNKGANACLAPFQYLLENALHHKKMSQSDVKLMHCVSRVMLLRSVVTRLSGNFHLRNLCDGLVRGDELVAQQLQKSNTHGCLYLQFPDFQPSDLVICLQLTTPSGTFPGPFASKSLVKLDEDSNVRSVQQALMICAGLLGLPEARDRISKAADSSQWFSSLRSEENPLRQLWDMSNGFGRFENPEWLISPEADPLELKRVLGLRPGEGLVQKKFPNEFRQAVNEKGAWDTQGRLSILFILLRARAFQEERTEPRSQSWKDRWHSELLSPDLDREHRPFGYRVANLLGCDLVEDSEARVAGLLFDVILSYENRRVGVDGHRGQWPPDPGRAYRGAGVGNLDRRAGGDSQQVSAVLQKNKLDVFLFSEMRRYLKLLLDQEAVPLQDSPLIDLSGFFARTVYAHFKRLFQIDEKKCTTQYEPFCQEFRSSFSGLVADIKKWLTRQGKERNLPAFTARVKTLQAQIDSGIEGAVDLAKQARFVMVGGVIGWRKRRLELLATDDTLDDYFARSGDRCTQFLNASKDLADIYKPAQDLGSKQALDCFLTHFPDLHRSHDASSALNPGEINDSRENIEILIQTIKLFTPFFACIKPREPRTLSRPIRVSKPVAAAYSQEFNILIGEHQKKLEFLVSAMTVDFGVHIDQASAKRCGIVAIENLSSDSVNVNMDNVDHVNLIGRLKASTVPRGGQIEIIFCFEDGLVKLPMMSWLTCKIVATSTQIRSQTAICSLYVFVKRAPLCAVINSSDDFLLRGPSCALAPSGYRTSIQLTHSLPGAFLSSRSIGFSLSSDSQNQTERPRVDFDFNTKRLDIQFMTRTTGRCVGSLTAGLGKCQLYSLSLSVFVDKDSSLTIYHPADPGNVAITIADTRVTYVVVENRSSDKRNVKLISSGMGDGLEPAFVEVGGRSTVVVKVTLGSDVTRSITAGSSRLDITKAFGRYELKSPGQGYKGQTFVTPNNSYVRACILYTDREDEVCFTNGRVLPDTQATAIVTETEMFLLARSQPRRNPETNNSWCLHAQRGFECLNPGDPITPGAMVLWEEFVTDRTSLFVPVLEPGVKKMSEMIMALTRISSATMPVAELIRNIITAAARLLPYSVTLAKIEVPYVRQAIGRANSSSPLSKLLQAMASESTRSGKAFETIAHEIAQAACHRPTFEFAPPPKDSWKGTQPAQYRGVQFLWYSIFLLHFLMDPFRPTSQDIEEARAKLAVRPDPPIVRATGAGDSKCQGQPITGDPRRQVGVIGGVFQEASAVEQIFEAIKQLQPPSIFVNSQQALGTALSGPDSVELIETKLDQVITMLSQAANPKHLYELILLVRSLSIEIVVSVRYAGNEDISSLIEKFADVTQIFLDLSTSCENSQILGEFIKDSLQICLAAWKALEANGISTPSFENLATIQKALDPDRAKYLHDVSQVPVPECELPLGRWLTLAEMAAHNASGTGMYLE
jgi:MoxR-like ATPase